MRLSCICLLLFSYFTASSSDQKPNILFQGLRSKSHIESLFAESLEARIRSALVNRKRINVITRDSTYWSNLRKELEIRDFLDEKTAVQLGNLSGASHYLDGIFIRYVTDTKTERSPDGRSRTTHNAFCELSVSLINLESGKNEASFTVQKSVWRNDADDARAVAFSQLAAEVAERLSILFPIHAEVSSFNPVTRELEINKGELDGVTAQSTYFLATDKNVVIKVTQTSIHSSKAKLLAGDAEKLKAGAIMNESFENARNIVRIASIKDGAIYLDGGGNLAIKEGDIFVIRKRTSIAGTASTAYEESIPAVVVVTQVKDDFAKAKITKGFDAIEVGAELVATDDRSLVKRRFIFAGYKYGFTPGVKANGNNGTVTVTNDAGEFLVATDYNDASKDISSVGIISLGFGTHNLAKSLSTSVYADIYNIGNGELGNWIAHLDLAHERMIKENLFYVFYGGGVGYGGINQSVPENVIQTISAGKSKDARSNSLFATAKVGARLLYGNVALSLSCSYDYLKYKSWTYETAGTTNDVPSAVLPYPVVDLSGIYGSASLSYFFNK